MTQKHDQNGLRTPSKRRKTPAMDNLLKSFGQVIDSGAEKMSPSELRESEKRFNQIVDRAAGARKRQRETA
jgi:hypothetical protein